MRVGEGGLHKLLELKEKRCVGRLFHFSSLLGPKVSIIKNIGHSG